MQKLPVAIGAVLIAVGIASFSYQGITYTKQEQVLKIGELEVTAEKNEKIPVPPIVGGITLVGGILLVLLGMRRK